MGDAKNTSSYRQGGEGDSGGDNVGQNPTGRARKSSARSRGKALRRLLGGTAYEDQAPKAKEPPKKGTDPKTGKKIDPKKKK